MTYRTTHHETCSLCGHRATLRCPRCGCPFCSDHGIFGDEARCSDCEAQYAGRQDKRSFVAALCGVGTGVGTAAAFVALGTTSLIWIPLTVLCAALGGAVVGAPWRWASRRRFLREGKGERVIEGALTISAHGGDQDAEARRLTRGWQPRERGMPSAPLYQRTFGH